MDEDAVRRGLLEIGHHALKLRAVIAETGAGMVGVLPDDDDAMLGGIGRHGILLSFNGRFILHMGREARIGDGGEHTSSFLFFLPAQKRPRGRFCCGAEGIHSGVWISCG